MPERFEQVVLPHLDAAYNLARWLMRSPADAEDAVQEACLRALDSLTALAAETSGRGF
jgi:DNA-directed RNA polymerase specialized sigma24 family protein